MNAGVVTIQSPQVHHHGSFRKNYSIQTDQETSDRL